MILQNKDTGKKMVLEGEEITMEALKEASIVLCYPNMPDIERVLVASFPNEKPDFNENLTKDEMFELFKLQRAASEDRHRLYEVLAEEVRVQLTRISETDKLLGSDRELSEGTRLQDLNLEPVNFSKIFIPQIGNLHIEK